MMISTLGRIKMLVGVRYAVKPDPVNSAGWGISDLVYQLKIRSGVGSLVIEAEPIAGPIWLIAHDDDYIFAQCANCGDGSKLYRRAGGERHCQRWAHAHRCPPWISMAALVQRRRDSIRRKP